MKKFLILFLLAACSPSQIPPKVDGYPVTVKSITDGDTFAIDAPWSPFPNLKWKVRIRGIDTPEKHSRCADERSRALAAQAYAARIINRSNFKVWLKDVDHDRYGGRFDATVILADGTSFADKMIQGGYARPYDGGKRQPWC